MTFELATAELSDLLKQAQEQLTYFQELGVTEVDPIPAPPTMGTVPPPSANLTQEFNQTPPQPFQSLFDTSRSEEVLPQSSESLEQIWAELKDCTRCSLHEGRTHVVNTEGNRRA